VNLEIHPEPTTSKLPNTCNKVAARSTGAQMINVNDHQKIVDEIACHAIFDFYEEEDGNNEKEEHGDDINDVTYVTLKCNLHQYHSASLKSSPVISTFSGSSATALLQFIVSRPIQCLFSICLRFQVKESIQ
jgi:hypothetical protein